jgi:hypothetical protein
MAARTAAESAGHWQALFAGEGDFAQKSVSCMSCDVFKMVKNEEGPENFVLLKPGQVYTAAK